MKYASGRCARRPQSGQPSIRRLGTARLVGVREPRQRVQLVLEVGPLGERDDLEAGRAEIRRGGDVELRDHITAHLVVPLLLEPRARPRACASSSTPRGPSSRSPAPPRMRRATRRRRPRGTTPRRTANARARGSGGRPSGDCGPIHLEEDGESSAAPMCADPQLLDSPHEEAPLLPPARHRPAAARRRRLDGAGPASARHAARSVVSLVNCFG